MIHENPSYYTGLLRELLKIPKECEWVEFKHNNSDKEDIGSYLSALSNSAALLGKMTAYVVWGIEDGSHHVLGTSFNPFAQKVGNEELENWLLQRLKPKLHFKFHSLEYEGKQVVILEIPAASKHPTSFQNEEKVRVGSYRKKLKDFPEKERELWRALDKAPFESLAARIRMQGDKVLQLLDYIHFLIYWNNRFPMGIRLYLRIFFQKG